MLFDQPLVQVDTRRFESASLSLSDRSFAGFSGSDRVLFTLFGCFQSIAEGFFLGAQLGACSGKLSFSFVQQSTDVLGAMACLFLLLRDRGHLFFGGGKLQVPLGQFALDDLGACFCRLPSLLCPLPRCVVEPCLGEKLLAVLQLSAQLLHFLTCRLGLCAVFLRDAAQFVVQPLVAP